MQIRIKWMAGHLFILFTVDVFYTIIVIIIRFQKQIIQSQLCLLLLILMDVIKHVWKELCISSCLQDFYDGLKKTGAALMFAFNEKYKIMHILHIFYNIPHTKSFTLFAF